MKKILLFLLPIMAFATVIMSSCSNDDDNDTSLPFDKETIVGTWEITSASSSTWGWIKEGAILIFNTNGSCSTGFSMENAYKIENGVVETYYKATNEPMLIYTLLSVDSGVYTVKVAGTLDEINESVIIKMKKK